MTVLIFESINLRYDSLSKSPRQDKNVRLSKFSASHNGQKILREKLYMEQLDQKSFFPSSPYNAFTN